MSASGHYIKPMIVFPGQRFSYNPLAGFEEAAFGRADSGWMDTELFKLCLGIFFIPDVTAGGVKRPLVLFVDEHSTHLRLVKFAKKMVTCYTVSSNIDHILCKYMISSCLVP